jgi:ubiquinone/menaquinone biosynthesis C-methylase UbiE
MTFNWFKPSALDPLGVSMTSVKLGNRLLVVGCGDPALIAALAAKAGLTGHACAVDESAERATQAGLVALREGVLLETKSAPLNALPFEAESFDLVVIRDVFSGDRDARATAVLHEAQRVVRSGGRCMVINTSAARPARGLAGIFGGRGRDHSEESAEAAALVSAVKAAGFLAVRTLAEREGLIFVEGSNRKAER